MIQSILPEKMKNMMKDKLQVPKTTAKRLTFSVGVGSAVFALLSYACSSPFKHLFGEWNYRWKIIVYAIFSLITLVAVVVLPMLTTPPDLPRFGEYAGLVKFFVLVLGSLYSFFVHRHNEEEDGDFALASYIAFVIASLCCGLEALMCFFLQITFIQLLKIYWVLGALAMGISSVLIEGPPQKYLVEQMGNREEVVRLVLVAFLPVESWCYVLVEYFHDDGEHIFRDDKQKLFKIIMVPIGYCYFLCFPYFLTRMAAIWKISRQIVLLKGYMGFIILIMSLVIMYHIWEGISDFWVMYYFYLYFFILMNVAIGRLIFIFLDLGMIYVTLVLPISFQGLPVMNQLLLGFSFIGFCCSLVITYLSIKYGENYPVIQERSQDPRPNVASPEASTSSSSQSRQSSSASYLGVGLENLGNTCFMNVILQCFAHTVPFVQQLPSFYQHTPCSDNDRSLCVFWALREIIEALLLNNPGAPVHPEKLANNLSYFSADFVKGRQCDAHEFMQCALDKLKECFPDGKDNLVDKIFSGEIVSKFSYSGCDHDQPLSYTTPEPLLNLMLDIDGVKSVEKALELFFKVDKIEQVTCDTCGKHVFRRQQLFLNKTPKIAVLKLNRIKKDEHVDFPMDLDLKPYYTNMDSNENVILTYYLYAVVVHSGENLNSGHYYCFVCTSENNWCKYDDSKATEASESEVLGEEAYILFYAQQGTPWFVNSMSVLKDTTMDENVDRSKEEMAMSSGKTNIRKNLLTRTQKSEEISSPRKRRAQIPI